MKKSIKQQQQQLKRGPPKKRSMIIDSDDDDYQDESDEVSSVEEGSEEELQESSAEDDDEDEDNDADLRELRSSLLVEKGAKLVKLIKTTLRQGQNEDDDNSLSTVTVLSFLFAARKRPDEFKDPAVIKSLISLLLPGKSNVQPSSSLQCKTSEFLCHLLSQILKEKELPTDLLEAYLQDATHARVWVDDPACQFFTKEIVHAINQSADEKFVVSFLKSKVALIEKGRKSSSSTGTSSSNLHLRNVIQTCIEFISQVEVRVFVTLYIEKWIQNTSTKASAKVLLGAVARYVVVTTNSSGDKAVASFLCQMKLNATMWQTQVDTICQLVSNRTENLRLALKIFVSNERLKNMSVAVDNMKLIRTIFKRLESSKEDDSSTVLSSRDPSPQVTPGRCVSVTPRSSSTNAASPHVLSVAASPVVGMGRTTTTNSADKLFFTRPMVHAGSRVSFELGYVLQDLVHDPEMSVVIIKVVRKLFKGLRFEVIDCYSLCRGLLTSEKKKDLKELLLIKNIVCLAMTSMAGFTKTLSQIQGSSSSSGASSRMRHASITGNSSISGTAGATATTALRQSPHYSNTTTTIENATPSRVDASVIRPSPHSSDRGVSSPSLPPLDRMREGLVQVFAKIHDVAMAWVRQEFTPYVLSNKLSQSELVSVIESLLMSCEDTSSQMMDSEKQVLQYCQKEIPIYASTLSCLIGMASHNEQILSQDVLATAILPNIIHRAAVGQSNRERYWAQSNTSLDTYVNAGAARGIEYTDDVSIVEFLIEHVVRSNESPNNNSQQDIWSATKFWIIVPMLLTLGAFNPSSIGATVWAKLPTLRCAMQMAISNRWTSFPPVDIEDKMLIPNIMCDDAKSVSTVLADANKQLSEAEAPYKDVMLSSPYEVARSSDTTLKQLQSLEASLLLGQRLRKCRDPDFLLQMITCTSRNPNDIITWISDIVSREPDTVSYLPTSCVSQLLTMIFEEKISTSHHRNDLELQVPSLLHQLRSIVFEKKKVSKVIIYFMERLTLPSVVARRVARKLLELILVADEFVVDEDCLEKFQSISDEQQQQLSSSNDDFKWLSVLGSITKGGGHSELKLQVLRTMELVLQRETSINPLKCCILALKSYWDEIKDSTNTTSGGDDNLALALLVARLLVNRSYVAKMLLQCDEVAIILTDALLALVLQDQESCQNEELLVEFKVKNSENVTTEIKLPAIIVSGCIELLTLCPNQKHKSFDKLAAYLFPNSTNENDELLGIQKLVNPQTNERICSTSHLHLLSCSSNTRLVRASLAGMTEVDLWKLLLSFGRSCECISELLCVLNQIIVREGENQGQALKDAVSSTTVKSSSSESLSFCAKVALQYLDAYSKHFIREGKWSSELIKEAGGSVKAFLNSLIKENTDDDLSTVMEVQVENPFTRKHPSDCIPLNPLQLNEILGDLQQQYDDDHDNNSMQVVEDGDPKTFIAFSTKEDLKEYLVKSVNDQRLFENAKEIVNLAAFKDMLCAVDLDLDTTLLVLKLLEAAAASSSCHDNYNIIKASLKTLIARRSTKLCKGTSLGILDAITKVYQRPYDFNTYETECIVKLLLLVQSSPDTIVHLSLFSNLVTDCSFQSVVEPLLDTVVGKSSVRKSVEAIKPLLLTLYSIDGSQLEDYLARTVAVPYRYWKVLLFSDNTDGRYVVDQDDATTSTTVKHYLKEIRDDTNLYKVRQMCYQNPGSVYRHFVRHVSDLEHVSTVSALSAEIDSANKLVSVSMHYAVDNLTRFSSKLYEDLYLYLISFIDVMLVHRNNIESSVIPQCSMLLVRLSNLLYHRLLLHTSGTLRFLKTSDYNIIGMLSQVSKIKAYYYGSRHTNNIMLKRLVKWLETSPECISDLPVVNSNTTSSSVMMVLSLRTTLKRYLSKCSENVMTSQEASLDDALKTLLNESAGGSIEVLFPFRNTLLKFYSVLDNTVLKQMPKCIWDNWNELALRWMDFQAIPSETGAFFRAYAAAYNRCCAGGTNNLMSRDIKTLSLMSQFATKSELHDLVEDTLKYVNNPSVMQAVVELDQQQ